MRAQLKIWCQAVVATALLAGPLTSLQANENLDPIVAQARQILNGHAERGHWQNPILPSATGERHTLSADQRMKTMLSRYTRQMLDRGGWVNQYVDGAPGYDAGNVLLALLPGDGATTIR